MGPHRVLGRATLPLILALLGSMVATGASASGLDRSGPETIESKPLGREEMGLAYDVDHQVLVLFGGIATFSQDFEYLGDTWTWDGSAWSRRRPSQSPPAGYGASMVYVAGQHEVVLFGGSDGQTVSDQTWTWDGADWTEQHPVHSPPAQVGGAMAFDSVSAEVVLLTGHYYTPGTTWTWDGTDWAEESPSTSPAPRAFPASAFDEATGTFVVFGGVSLCGDFFCPLSDTWTWDGTTWTEGHPAHHPTDRAQAALAFDPNTGRGVLFGQGALDRSHTWTWDGTDWSHIRPLPSPRSRSGSGMAYDAALGEVVLFGGLGSNNGTDLYSYNDLWTWDGTSWTRVG
jgi:hypothetical protein